MGKLNFYDVKTKKSFTTSNYRIVTKQTKRGSRKFAVAKGPKGNDCWRVIGK